MVRGFYVGGMDGEDNGIHWVFVRDKTTSTRTALSFTKQALTKTGLALDNASVFDVASFVGHHCLPLCFVLCIEKEFHVH